MALLQRIDGGRFLGTELFGDARGFLFGSFELTFEFGDARVDGFGRRRDDGLVETFRTLELIEFLGELVRAPW